MACESPPSAKRKRSSFSDQFEMLQVLGRGRNAVVRLAKCRNSGMLVAVKVVSRHVLGIHQSMVRTEILVFQRIKNKFGTHPNLGSMYSVFEEENATYIVMEYLGGGELFDQVVARGSFSEKDASILTKKIILAIMALHEVSVVHRDVKPENIVFQSQGDDSEIKVIDFGHCHIMEQEASMARNLVGTPGYLAPEVIVSKVYTPACDIWSTGVILYILLSGYPPFYSHSNNKLYEKIKKGEFVFDKETWGNISSEAKNLISRMLTVNPEFRISCDEVLQHPWIATNNRTEAMPDIIKRLGTFNARRKLRAAAMACVWGAGFGRKKKIARIVKNTQFSQDELNHLGEVFKQFAVDGAVTKEHFTKILKELGFGALPCERLYELFDKDGDNYVDYKEFLLGIGTLRDDNESTLRFCFDLFDEDRSGFISRDELQAVFRYIAAEDEGTEYEKAERLTELFEQLDSNRDNLISFDEFRSGISAEPRLIKAFTHPAQVTLTSSSSGSPKGGVVSPKHETLRTNRIPSPSVRPSLSLVIPELP